MIILTGEPKPLRQHLYCPHCGSFLVKTDAPKSPQTCLVCVGESFHSPQPVAVVLVPVVDAQEGRIGFLVGLRGIEPQMGTWGLPGGFLDPTDPTLEHAAVRELVEEVGLIRSVSELAYLASTVSTNTTLVFYMTTPVSIVELSSTFIPNKECPEIKVVWEPEELSFESHTRALSVAFDFMRSQGF